jgi:hypothetical protein
VRKILLVAAYLIASQAAAQTPLLIPLLTNENQLESDIRIENTGSLSATVAFELIAGAADQPAVAVQRTIAPGQTLVLKQALRSLWGLTGRSGAVRLTANQPLLAWATLYGTGVQAPFSFAIAAQPDATLLGSGDTGHCGWLSQSASGSAGMIGVVLTAPRSSVTLSVIDDAGKQLAQKIVTGGPLWQEIPVATLTGGDVPIGRVTFQVTAGRATGFLVETDIATGSASATFSAPAASLAGNVVIAQAKAAAGGDVTTTHTDVRLSNLGLNTATVSVLALSSSQTGLAGQSTLLTLSPGQTVEIGDVLATLFQALSGTIAALQFASSDPLLVLAREIDPVAPEPVYPAAAISSFLTAGQSATLLGLNGESEVNFLAGLKGAAATLLLVDSAGHVLSTREGAIQLGPSGFQSAAIASLFPDVADTMPQEMRLDVRASTGSLLTTAAP